MFEPAVEKVRVAIVLEESDSVVVSDSLDVELVAAAVRVFVCSLVVVVCCEHLCMWFANATRSR